MNAIQHDIDERTKLTSNNQFELLLFRLGESEGSTQRELFGINVFKIREIQMMPPVVPIAGLSSHILGVANIRGQVIPVIDLAAMVGCKPRDGLNILLVTEYARSTQGFAVEEVDDIVRLDWSQVRSAESSAGGKTITSIARLDGDVDNTRLAQVLDVEQILHDLLPPATAELETDPLDTRLTLPPGGKILFADDSGFARSLVAHALQTLELPYIEAKTGQEAWDLLQSMTADAIARGKPARDVIPLVLTDLEMPEMDGFTLTRKIKSNDALRAIPVVIHSSLSGSANEDHVRRVGANGYVAKFAPEELAAAIAAALRS